MCDRFEKDTTTAKKNNNELMKPPKMVSLGEEASVGAYLTPSKEHITTEQATHRIHL